MLKLSDPLESELFVGLFYNAETEDRGFQSRRERRMLPEALTRWIRNVGSCMTRLRQQTETFAQEDECFNEKQPEALTSECHHLEASASGFRPLTQEEKKEFLNSLDEKGKKILAELGGRKTTVKRSRKRVLKVFESGAATIVPDINAASAGVLEI